MKNYFVKDLLKSIGLTGESEFALVKKERRVTKAEKPFLDLLLKDRTGEVTAKVWSDSMGGISDVDEGSVVWIDFEVREYLGKADLNIRAMKKAENFDTADFIDIPDGMDPDELKAALTKRIDSVRDFNLRQLLDRFFEDPDFKEAFLTVPAAEKVHQDHRHGLLKHTLEMLDVIDAIFLSYPDLNRDLLVTGAILHDMGKLKENDVSSFGIAKRSTAGRLLGHINLGLEMLQAKLPENFPPTLKLELEHIIVSHQGKPEWGSVKVPATREAMAIHMADMVSTYMNIIHKSYRDGKDGKHDYGSDLFSEYNKYLLTSVFLGGED